MILVDTNVLLDVLQDDPTWAGWSQDQLESAQLTDRLIINPVIYSELSIAFERIEELEAAVRAYPILTRDVARYRSYYPRVRLIAPD